MKIIYTILAHNQPKLLKQLVEKLNSENVYFIIHIDKKIDIQPFLLPKEFDNVIYLCDNERISTIWGDISCTNAVLNMFKKANELLNNEEGYCVLLSGVDYPTKSNDYIKSFFNKEFPMDFYACHVIESKKKYSGFEKLCINNFCNYWVSFENTRFKLEIKPRRFIRPRCCSLKECFIIFPKILKKHFEILHLFLFGSRKNPYYILQNNKEHKFCITSETWIALSSITVKKLVEFHDNNKVFFDRAKYIHCTEESLLQNIVYSFNTSRKDFLTDTKRKNGGASVDLDDGDLDFIKSSINKEDKLFVRKLNENNCEEIFSVLNGGINCLI